MSTSKKITSIWQGGLRLITTGLFLFFSCDDDIGGVIEKENEWKEPVVIIDTIEPVPGDDGFISFISTTDEQIIVVWCKALDDISNQVSLKYQLYISENANIANYGQTLTNGKSLSGWTTNIDHYTVSGLSPDATYYFNVMVKDEQENVAMYTMADETTDPAGGDVLEPVPDDSGILTFTGIGSNEVTVNWPKATDDTSKQEKLVYSLYFSQKANIGNYGQANKNGTLVFEWKTDIDTYTVPKLTADTTYYFNVMVKDESGNIAKYTMSSVTTLANSNSTITNNI